MRAIELTIWNRPFIRGDVESLLHNVICRNCGARRADAREPGGRSIKAAETAIDTSIPIRWMAARIPPGLLSCSRGRQDSDLASHRRFFVRAGAGNPPSLTRTYPTGSARCRQEALEVDQVR